MCSGFQFVKEQAKPFVSAHSCQFFFASGEIWPRIVVCCALLYLYLLLGCSHADLVNGLGVMVRDGELDEEFGRRSKNYHTNNAVEKVSVWDEWQGEGALFTLRIRE